MAALFSRNFNFMLLIEEITYRSSHLISFKKLKNIDRWILCHYYGKILDLIVKTKDKTKLMNPV